MIQSIANVWASWAWHYYPAWVRRDGPKSFFNEQNKLARRAVMRVSTTCLPESGRIRMIRAPHTCVKLYMTCCKSQVQIKSLPLKKDIILASYFERIPGRS